RRLHPFCRPSLMPLSVNAAGTVAGATAWLVTGLLSLGTALPAGALPPGAVPATGPRPTPPVQPAPAPVPVPTAAPPPPPFAPISDEAFAALLKGEDPEALGQACLQAIQEDRKERLRQLQDRLQLLHPAPQPLAVVLGDAEVLLACKAPEAALKVLDRYGPAPGPRRDQWLLLQWRAASDALDHRRAALALERLTAGRPERLEALALTLQRREDGTVVSRPALDVLAGHLEARGLPRAAGEVLLASRLPGVAGALRLQQAFRLLPDLPTEEREALLEAALEQAAAEGAWGLVTELLDQQAALPSARAVERRLRLSPRLDDAYGEWLLRQGDPASLERARQLELRLRSPRTAGGHAPPDPAAVPMSPSPPRLP
ncbi:MAG TPA: hypothetical protein VER57_01420, partial [Cyanobium sp.]|nr:hypothetical protein [Cyanobium sp.]